MKSYPLSSTSIAPRTVAFQMDTTYWSRNFGVVLFMDVATHRFLHFSFIYRKERIEDYLSGIAYLKRQVSRVNGVISDRLSAKEGEFDVRNPFPRLGGSILPNGLQPSCKGACRHRASMLVDLMQGSLQPACKGVPFLYRRMKCLHRTHVKEKALGQFLTNTANTIK